MSLDGLAASEPRFASDFLQLKHGVDPVPSLEAATLPAAYSLPPLRRC